MASKSKKNVFHFTGRIEQEQKIEIPSDPSSIRQWILSQEENQPAIPEVPHMIELNFMREIPVRSSRPKIKTTNQNSPPDICRAEDFPVLQTSRPPPNPYLTVSNSTTLEAVQTSNSTPIVEEDTLDWVTQQPLEWDHKEPKTKSITDNHTPSSSVWESQPQDNENDNNNYHSELYQDNHKEFGFPFEEQSHYHIFEELPNSTLQIFMDFETVQQELNQLEDLFQNGFIQEDEYNNRKEKLLEYLPAQNTTLVETAVDNLNQDFNTVEGKSTIEEDSVERSDVVEDSFEQDEVADSVNNDIEEVSTITEVSAMELLKQKMMEKSSATITIDKVNLETLLSQTQKIQNPISEVSNTIREYPFVPLIVHGDLSRLACNVLVLPTGCFVTSGVMDSMATRYGKYLPVYLRKKFKVGKYPIHLPPYKNRTAKDFQNLKAMGGLSQGFVAWIGANELRDFAEDKTVSPLVLCVVGGDYDGHISVESISVAVKNVFKAVSAQVSTTKSITVAFPAFGIGKGSLSRDRVPALYSQIEAMNDGHKQYPFLIPVLVTYSDTIQRLALAARTKLFQFRGDKNLPRVLRSDTEMAVIPELQSELEADRLAVFVGAGVSLSAGLPSWSQFVQNLAGKAGLKQQKSEMTTEELLKVSEQAKQMLGVKFGAAFKESLGYLPDKFNPIPSLTHYYVASLSKSIVTTNYDDLLEQALSNMKKAAFVINTPQDVARVPLGEQVNVLKIHGDITNPKESVLTRSDYESYFAKRPAVSTMLKGLLLNRTFLFIGYSLRDLNLQIILNEVSQMLRDARRPAFAVVFESTDNERQYWAERGVQLLTVTGDSSRDKTVSLWQFLDVLQMKYFAPHGAWLAEDAADLFPEHCANELDTSMTRLRSSIYRLLSEWERDPSPELADFLFPFLMTAAKHGLSISRDSWNLLAKHYANRTPATEVTHLMALSAAIAALQQSGGRAEHQHRDYLHQLQKDFMK